MSPEHEVTVRVVSPEAADIGVAEFSLGDRVFGFTRVQEGELLLSIQPPDGGGEVLVNAHSLAEALAQAKALLESY